MLTINTNLSAMIINDNLKAATLALNTSMERMTTGLRINSAADDAAGLAVATKMVTQLSSFDVASSNVQIGSNVLGVFEDTYELINGHLSRIRNLTEQAANGTYATSSKEAIVAEIDSRVAEINRLAKSTEFNGIKLLDGSSTEMNIQVGIGSTENDYIKIDSSVFGLQAALAHNIIGANWAEGSAGQYAVDNASNVLGDLDTAIKGITSRITSVGAFANRLDSAGELLEVLNTNMTSSLSTVRDADISTESSNYIRAQILQQASASLLTTANQQPSIVLNLI